MRKLTGKWNLNVTLSPADIELFEMEYDLKIPDNLKTLLLAYEGENILEYIFQVRNEKGKFLELKRFLMLRDDGIHSSIEAILKGHQYYGIKGFLPFAIDPGGWDFNIGISNDNTGQIWINEVDAGDESPFKFVSPSLDDFINELMTFEEACKEGF